MVKVIASDEPHGDAVEETVAELFVVDDPGKVTARRARILVGLIIKPINPAEMPDILKIPHNVIGT